MSASMAGAMKAHLESLGMGVPWYRDGAPKGSNGQLVTSWPYGVLQEGVGYAPELHGDTDDPQAHLGTTELVQVDLYQHARELTGTSSRVVEDYTLADRVAAALRRMRPGVEAHAPWRVYGVSVDSGQRWPISDNVVRHTWTVRVRRDTERRVA